MNGDARAAMRDLKIPEVNEVIVGELAERGEWVVADVETRTAWPVKAQKVSYRGNAIWIMPIMTGHYPAVALKVLPDRSRAECERLLMQFISTLSWVERVGMLVEGIGGGSLPRPFA